MRFAGRVSAANYIAAGNNAANQSSDMIETARRNAPDYEAQVTEAIRQDAANYDNAVTNAAKIINAGTCAQGGVAVTEQDLERRKAILKGKQGVRKAGMVAMAGAALGSALEKDTPPPVKTKDTSVLAKELKKEQELAAAARTRAEEIKNSPLDISEIELPETKPQERNFIPTSRGGDIALRMMNDFVAKGYSPVQAAAIVGNAQYESMNFQAHEELAPNVYGTKGAGYIQWTNTPDDNRRDQFENWSKAQGFDPKSYEASAGYLAHEMAGNSGNKWTGGVTDQSFRKIGDLRTAVEVYQDNYLRPNPQYANTSARYANAEALLSRFNVQ